MLQSVPYLNFQDGKEALEYYKEYFEAEVVSLTTADNPMFHGMPDLPEHPEDFVMNAEFKIFGARIYLSSTWNNEPVNQKGVSIALVFDEDDKEAAETAKRVFEKASATGKVTHKFEEVPWTKYFGSFDDKYGINWSISGE